jgi:hypothetical protein
MGRRSRKVHRPGAVPTGATLPPPAPRPARPPRRSSEERDAEIRAQLEPLAPGERPVWLTVAAGVATLMAIATLVLIVADTGLTGGKNTPVAGVIQAVALLIAAAGMWLTKYWAVLGFQCLLALTMVYGFISLLFASNILGVVLASAIVGGATFLFYKLIRAMARVQMPRRP